MLFRSIVMQTFLSPLMELNEYTEAQLKLQRRETPLQVTGCIDTQKSHLLYGLGLPYPLKVIITHNELRAKEICEEFRLYDRDVYYYLLAMLTTNFWRLALKKMDILGGILLYGF